MKELKERMDVLEILLTDLSKIVFETLIHIMKERDDFAGLSKLMAKLTEWQVRMEKVKS